MNLSYPATRPAAAGPTHRESTARRAARRLARGPAVVPSPATRWAVNVAALLGAALMVWSAVIHLQLWADGYRSIAVIGPLFLIQGIGSIVLALAIAVSRRAFLLAAGGVMMAGTAVGLLVSASVGLFGFQDSLAVPGAMTSLVAEFGAAAVLAAAATALAARRR